jgi:hypothetical protein
MPLKNLLLPKPIIISFFSADNTKIHFLVFNPAVKRFIKNHQRFISFYYTIIQQKKQSAGILNHSPLFDDIKTGTPLNDAPDHNFSR